LLGNIIHRDFFTGFDDANGDVAAVAAARIGIAGVIHETCGRVKQDVLSVHDRKKSALFFWKSLDLFVAQHFPASINDHFACLDSRCCKDSAPVNWRRLYHDSFHVLRLGANSTAR